MAWYVLMTAPQRERRAAAELRARGYTVYWPTVEVPARVSRHARRARRAHEPLFPGYIFCHQTIPWREMSHRDPQCLRDGAGRRLLAGLVAVSGAAKPIPEAIMGRIADTVHEVERRRRQPARRLKPGDIGVIRSGPLAGGTGEILAIDRGVAEIAVRIFNAVRAVRARLDQLEAA